MDEVNKLLGLVVYLVLEFAEQTIHETTRTKHEILLVNFSLYFVDRC
jgi:hypothetical protein